MPSQVYVQASLPRPKASILHIFARTGVNSTFVSFAAALVLRCFFPPLPTHLSLPSVGLQLDVVWCLIQGYLFRGGTDAASEALRQLRSLLTKALLAAENR